MGDPKRQRRTYEIPKYPWSKLQLDAELRLLGEYGLRNKRELRRHHATLVKYRSLARDLLAMSMHERLKIEQELILKLQSYGIISEGSNVDNVLELTIQNILERRLQTIVFRRGLARTPHQARQLVTHGHIAVKERKVTSPSYLVKRDEELNISYSVTSRFSKDDGDIREVSPSQGVTA